jgi:Spy/CpxP family protein refolding chaperone
MTHFNSKRLVQLGTTMLAAGALLLPTIGAANASQALVNTSAAAPSVGITKVSSDSPAPNDFRKLRKSVNQLGLSTDQQQEIDALITAAQPQAAELQKNMRDVKEQMKAQMFPENDQYNAKQVSELANRQGQLVTEMLELRAKVTFDVYSKLTPEQKQQLRTVLAEKAAKKGKPKS